MNENRKPAELLVGIYTAIKNTIEKREKTLYSPENHILEWSLIAASLVTSYFKTDYEIPHDAQSFCLDLAQCRPMVNHDTSDESYEIEWVLSQDEFTEVLTLKDVSFLMTE